MDVSEQYIKMCKTAEEIQEKWKPQTGDWHFHFACNEEEDHVDAVDADECSNYPEGDSNLEHLIERSVWLPRQDQLQEMVLSYTKQSPIQLASSFGEHQYGILFNNRIRGLKFPTHETSMEQLWLAYVMKEKYGKEWGGEEWK